jgi:DNA polymerase III subunit alpha
MYLPLYIKTENSLLESMITLDALVNYAKENNFKSLTITDNNMYGVMEFYNKCLSNNIKPIVGLELMIDNNEIVVYAMNYQGYKNLIKLSSSETLNITLLKEHSNNLLCVLPYKSYSLYDEISSSFEYIFIGYENDIEMNKIKEPKVYFKKVLYLNKEDKAYYRY